MITVVLFLLGIIVFVWALIQISDWSSMKKNEEYRQREINRNKAAWDALSPEQQRNTYLANFCIPSDYLPHVILDKSGEPCLPNYYLGKGLIPMRLMKLFSEKEIEDAISHACLKKADITCA